MVFFLPVMAQKKKIGSFHKKKDWNVPKILLKGFNFENR